MVRTFLKPLTICDYYWKRPFESACPECKGEATDNISDE
jgi:hypothetical protein